jgi:signal transduction histidine kinase
MPNLLTEQQIVAFLLNTHKVAYFITDQTLQVVEFGGQIDLFPRNSPPQQGQPLLEAAPELIGVERELQALLSGELPAFTIPMIEHAGLGGAPAYVNLTCLPYLDQIEQITGVLYLIEDVSTLGSLEQEMVQQRNELVLLNDRIAARNIELAAANTELRQLDEVKSRFISVAAHELRNPLASILGYLELLHEEGYDALTADQQMCVEAIQRSSQRLLSITNNLLDMTRIEAGRIELNLERVNLLTLVEHVAGEFQPQISAKKQTLVLDASPGVSMALCDEMRSSQILSNLLSNAIKYTLEKGMITIKLGATDDGQSLLVTVSDNGIGIAPHDKDKIFRSFFRGGNVHLTGEPGTGLGLSVAQALVELQGGRIWCESVLGKGSTFYVTFPVDDSDLAELRALMNS